MNKTEIKSAIISKNRNGITIVDIIAGREIVTSDVYELSRECSAFTGRTGQLLINLPADISISFGALKAASKVASVPKIAFVAHKHILQQLVNMVFVTLKHFGISTNMRAFETQHQAEVWLDKHESACSNP